MILRRNQLNLNDNNFDTSIYNKKRNIKNKDLSDSHSPDIYCYKKPIYKRKNSCDNFNLNQSSNYDINAVIQKKLEKLHTTKSTTPDNYSKKMPISQKNRIKRSLNLINYNDKYNSQVNNSVINKSKYLINSKLNNNFKNEKIDISYYNSIDLSSDNINNNLYNLNKNYKNNIINKSVNEYNVNNFYQKNKNYYSIDNCLYQPQIFNNKDQNKPFLQNKIKIRNKIVNNNEYYYNNNNDDNNNYINNNIINNYNNCNNIKLILILIIISRFII